MKMKEIGRKLKIGTIFMVVLGIFLIPIVSAETEVTYKVEPIEPKPLSDVTITVKIDDDTVSFVYLEMQECTAAGICYGWDTNVSMDSLGDNKYQATITLEHDDASYFSLRTQIDRGGEMEQTAEYKVDLIVEDGGNGDSNNGSNTPGFEIILLLTAVILGMVLFKRKRS
jgi:hypothetical protein